MAKRINAPPLFGGFARCALNPVRTIDGPLRQRRYCAQVQLEPFSARRSFFRVTSSPCGDYHERVFPSGRSEWGGSLQARKL